MKTSRGHKKVVVLRVDEIPLLYSVIKEYGIIELVNKGLSYKKLTFLRKPINTSKSS